MEHKDIEEILHSAVDECHAKLEIVNDYLERFKISDNRLVAPIHDIERCVDMMYHVMHHEGMGNDPHA